MGDNRGYRSIELRKRFQFQIKNIGSVSVYLSQIITILDDETINSLNLENTELSSGSIHSGFYEEEEIRSFISKDPPNIIQLYVGLSTNEEFYSNLIEF